MTELEFWNWHRDMAEQKGWCVELSGGQILSKERIDEIANSYGCLGIDDAPMFNSRRFYFVDRKIGSAFEHQVRIQSRYDPELAALGRTETTVLMPCVDNLPHSKE